MRAHRSSLLRIYQVPSDLTSGEDRSLDVRFVPDRYKDSDMDELLRHAKMVLHV